VLQNTIPVELLDSSGPSVSVHNAKPKEVILSEYFRGQDNG